MITFPVQMTHKNKDAVKLEVYIRGPGGGLGAGASLGTTSRI